MKYSQLIQAYLPLNAAKLTAKNTEDIQQKQVTMIVLSFLTTSQMLIGGIILINNVKSLRILIAIFIIWLSSLIMAWRVKSSSQIALRSAWLLSLEHTIYVEGKYFYWKFKTAASLRLTCISILYFLVDFFE